MSRLLIATVSAAALLALPAAALAMHEPGSAPAAVPAPAPANFLADGKYLQRPAAVGTQVPVQIVRVVKPVGFDFRDASIGAGLGALLVGALFGAFTLVSRGRGSSTVAAGRRAS